MTACVDKPRPREHSTSFTISHLSCGKSRRNIWYHSSVQQVSRCPVRASCRSRSSNDTGSFAINNTLHGLKIHRDVHGTSCYIQHAVCYQKRLFGVKTLAHWRELMFFTCIWYQNMPELLWDDKLSMWDHNFWRAGRVTDRILPSKQGEVLREKYQLA